MPKEIVRSRNAADVYEVRVGWSPDQDVQVGIASTEDRSLFWLLTGMGRLVDVQNDCALTDRLGKLGAQLRETLGLASGVRYDADIARDVLNALDAFTVIQYSSVWADLDRDGCNRLIRVLRRARDQAYGRDE